jgi:hypothetical protein
MHGLVVDKVFVERGVSGSKPTGVHLTLVWFIYKPISCLSGPPMTAIIDMIIMIVPVKVFMRLTEEWDRDSIQARWRSSSYG